jgi:hypothetical protein
MEKQAYLAAGQRAMLAARMTKLSKRAREGDDRDASIEAPVPQSEAAKRLRVGRSSVQRAADLLERAAPELVAAVDRGLIAVSTASELLPLSKDEQVKVATADSPRQAARQALKQLGMNRRSDVEPTRLFRQLTSAFEKTPTVGMRELVRLFLEQHATSDEQNEKLVESARACVTRFAELAKQIEERTLCGYQSCGRIYFRGRSKRAPGQKYCSRLCAQRAGESLAWQGP